MAHINPQIFREYDIRGIVDIDLNEDVLERIGRAYGTYIKDFGARVVSIGRDCRLSSPAYSKAMTRGINSTGVDVIDIGMVSTPMLYFSLYNLDVGGGVMITASHNPGEYNGIKLCRGKDSVFGGQIQKIREIAEAGEFASGNGSSSETDVEELYVSFLKENINMRPGLKAVVDYGNGMVGAIGPRVFREFGCDFKELYVTPDGTFPNHHPDPTVEENLAQLIETVRGGKFKLGIGFDGDGDRIGVVDEKGNIVWGDMLVLVFARDVISRKPGAKIIGDVKCSNRLFSGINEAGGEAIMWKTGHSLIKDKMKVEKASLAGEMSGHIFFADKFFGYDDALYASLRILEIISRTGKSLSQLLEGIPPAISTPEIRVDCPEAIKFRVVDMVKERLGKSYRIIDIDGARIEFPDGWGLIRASNTQPALVLRFEAQTEVRLSEIRALIEGELHAVMAELSN
ncbi:MAG: phosphomannomutase [Candidatus Dadabacteria bacterium RIFCSPHIGHO2_12_FULL_53_21]|nr:MAG: phosphomannomutase [Candidatus Dadabacteria bacterium RIFCSPHIGHO2_12_FULL_53_21]